MTEYLLDLQPDVELVFTTERSLWHVRTEHYRREPRAGRGPIERVWQDMAIQGRLDDDVWHAHLGALLVDDGYVYLRILPVAGAGGRGIMSGEVLAVDPREALPHR